MGHKSSGFIVVVVVSALFCVAALLAPAFALDVSPRDLGEQSVLFEQALKEMNLSAEDFKINLGDMGFYNRDKYQLQILRSFFDNPWRISPYSRMWTDAFLTNQNSLSNLIVGAQYKIGGGVRLNLPGYDTLSTRQTDIEKERTRSLANALSKLTGESVETYLTPTYHELPPKLRDALALFVYTLPEVVE